MRLVRAGDRRHHHRRRGDRQIEAVVLADAEHVEPGRIGELGGRHDFGIALRGADGAAASRIGGEVAKSVDAEFHAWRYPGAVAKPQGAAARARPETP